MKRSKKQSTILDSDNPYLVKRAENILNLAEKMKQLETKKKTKIPSPKTKQTTRLTLRLKKRVVGKKHKCTLDHTDYVASFAQETHKRYCTEKNDLHGVICCACHTNFRDREGPNVTVPSLKTPLWVCLGRSEFQCTYSLCSTCHMDKLDNSGGRKRHRRNV